MQDPVAFCVAKGKACPRSLLPSPMGIATEAAAVVGSDAGVAEKHGLPIILFELLQIHMSQRFIAVLIAPLLMTLMVASYSGKLEASPPLQASPPVTGINRYVGTYKGTLISVGTEFVITRFFLDSSGKMVGEYTMIPYQGSSKKNESGTLDNCEELPDSEFLCYWHDQYGDGLLALQFDDTASEFRGLWKPSGASHAPHMERKYWLEQTDWNGVRQ